MSQGINIERFMGKAFLVITDDFRAPVQDEAWDGVLDVGLLELPGGTELDVIDEELAAMEHIGPDVHIPCRVRDPYYPPVRVLVPHLQLLLACTQAEPGSGPHVHDSIQPCEHLAVQRGCRACFRDWWQTRLVSAGREDLMDAVTEPYRQEGLPPRLRTAGSVDLSKAKKDCRRCNGTGHAGYRTMDDPTAPGETMKVPIICRCVTRNGGVQKDVLDKLMEETQRQLESGTFATTLAKDIRRLPPKHRTRAIEALRRQAADDRKDPTARQAIQDALRALEEDHDGVPGKPTA